MLKKRITKAVKPKKVLIMTSFLVYFIFLNQDLRKCIEHAIQFSKRLSACINSFKSRVMILMGREMFLIPLKLIFVGLTDYIKPSENLAKDISGKKRTDRTYCLGMADPLS